MSTFIRVGAMLIVALMATSVADAAPRGRGGAPAAIGGGRVGGGAHFGGGAARSFARPSFGGGAVRSFARPSFGGGAVRSFGRPAFGGGVPRTFARPAFRGGAVRSFARPALGRAAPAFARPGFRGARGRIATARALRRAGALAARPAFRSRAAQRALAARTARAAAAATGAVAVNRALAANSARRAAAAAAIGGGFAARRAAQARWFGHWHRHHHRFAVFGWFGPVFWPYAYDDIFGGVFWPYAYAYDPFWDYGYGDIYGSLFSPYGYEDFVDTIPAGQSVRRRLAHARARGELPTGSVGAPDLSRYAALCGSDTRDVAGVPVDEIQKAVAPDDAQRAALDEVGNAAVKAAEIIKAACPTEVRLTPVGRLDIMQQRVQAMIEAVNTVRSPLDKFYGLLSDEQKARFNAIGQVKEERKDEKSLVRSCGTAGVAGWPDAQIDKMVRPTAEQREKLDALKAANAQAADTLKASCAMQMPLTPTARLAAIAERLDTMLAAIKSVRAPLDAFYQSLSDEQKAQFNAIGRAGVPREG